MYIRAKASSIPIRANSAVSVEVLIYTPSGRLTDISVSQTSISTTLTHTL